MKFNERLNFVRKRSKITQKSVSSPLGVTLRTYQRYEEGTIEPPLSTVSAIAEYFDIPADCLLGNGFFANWEDVLMYKDSILSSLSRLFPNLLEKLDLYKLSEKQLARILPAILVKVTFNREFNTITLYPLIPFESGQPFAVPSGGCETDLLGHPNS